MRRSSPADYLVVSMARLIPDGSVVASGVFSWLPMLAIALARVTRAPGLRYFNCAGAVDPPLRPLPDSSTSPSLLRDNPYCLQLTDLWDLAAGRRLDVMFFGFAQLDVRGNTNLSRLPGANGHPRKLAGVAGALGLRQLVRHPVLFCPRHSCASLVRRVDAVTTVAAGNPVDLVTDLGVFRLHGGVLHAVSLHPTASLREVRARTGFPVRAPRRPRITPALRENEWRTLDQLDRRKIRNRYVQP